MPTVAVDRDLFYTDLGSTLSDSELDELCFDFGIELDEIEDVAIAAEGESEGATDSKRIVYKFDIPANRYDLLCVEGLTRALRVFLNRSAAPRYIAEAPSDEDDCLMEMLVTPATQAVRAHVVCATLRNITFDDARYKSFIDLQDKLHQNICRKRSLASIGTHDLDTLKPPFLYDARAPDQIQFVALGQTEAKSAAQLLQMYSVSSDVAET